MGKRIELRVVFFFTLENAKGATTKLSVGISDSHMIQEMKHSRERQFEGRRRIYYPSPHHSPLGEAQRVY